ncbi:MAG TPA: RHS repeat-associated core domain-containing protein, partial [Blastocatellia bacterium]|nr:RHS repeat-associated core domain-containing protein [Blastocatellia bacterium]
GAFTYSYDTAPNGRGRLGSVSIQGALGLQVAADGYYYDGYDAIGNVTSGHQVTAGVSYPMTYGYDLAGHMTQQKYPSGRTINTTLDAAGRISDVQQPAATDYATAFTYAATGAVTSMTLGNHLVAHATYNSRQPTLIGLGTSSSDSSVFRLDYGFGTTANNGNVLSEAITIGDGGSSPTVFNQTFSYDSLNRLATAGETQGSSTTNWSRTYNYDRFGNMWVTNFQGVALSPLTPQAQGAYSANTNQFTAVPNSYDASGNQKVDAEGNTYQYDSDNHMTSCTIVATGTGSSYGYDATGHRVWKTVGATSTIFVYNVAGQLIAEYGGSATTNGGTSYLTTDHLGSTRVVTNSSRAVVARHDYLPFGEEVAATIGNRQSIGGYSGLDDTRQKFTGNERDAESTLDYCAARYYSGSLGRFTTADSLGGGASPQSLNLYAYTANNPLRYADPSGHDPISSLQIAPCSDAPMDDGDGSDNPDPHTVTDENGSHGLYSLAYHLTHPGEIPPKPEEVFTLDVFAATQIDPGPSPSSLDTFIGGGNLLEAFLSPPPADNAMVDQFFKSVLVDDVAGAAFSFGGEFFLPELMATAAATGGTAAEPAGKIVTEGIYEFVSSTGEGYVGQSGDIPRRIGEHLASAKLLPKDLSSLRTTEVLGGKTAREVAEQLRIIDLGGKDTLRNMVNPIGRAKANLLPQAARDFLGY